MPILDILGGILFFPFRYGLRKPASNPKNILIVRLDHIGDFVCTTPLFKNIKDRFPKARITALVNSVSKDLALRDPNIDSVIAFSPIHLARGGGSSGLGGTVRLIRQIRRANFDLGIEPRGDILSILIMWLGGVKYRIGYGITGGGFLLNKVCMYDDSKHVIDRNLALLEALDIPVSDRSPKIYSNINDRPDVTASGAVVIHPFAGAKAKEWPEANFQGLIDRIRNAGQDVLLVGSASDKSSYKNVIDLRGKLTLPQLACLMGQAECFIGLDSGPANMAAALNVPSIIICSGTNIPQLWIPNNPNVRFIFKDVECKPCGLKMCAKNKHECMDSISVDYVVDALRKVVR